MGETLETKKGQNLETIISKLSKEQPARKPNSYLLISGIDHSSLMFHVGSSGHESDEDDEPDLFQCGKCRQMFTNLQKYLRHKSSRECRQKSTSTPSTVTSPGFSEPGTLEGYDENSATQSPPKRKHDRKGIARRVSNVPETETNSDPPSPDTPVVLRDPPRPFGVGHPIPLGMPPVCTVINGLPSPVSRSGISAFQPPLPSLKSPTERGPIYSRPEASHQGPALASPHGYSVPFSHPQQGAPMQHVIINNPVHPSQVLTGRGWPRTTIAVDPHFSNNKEPIESPNAQPQVRPDGKVPAVSESRVQAPGISINSTAQPIVVHLKERGRPIRPKQTGLTEEELTEELVTPSGQKIFKCKKCEKEFSFSSRLKRHLLVHTGARPFECPICLRRFTQAVDLKRHMLRHSGQKPHVCQYCGKQYTRGDRLKVHLLSHTETPNHSLSSSRPYNCSRCNLSFEEAEHLHLHTCDKSEHDADGATSASIDPDKQVAPDDEDISSAASFNQEDSLSGSEDRGSETKGKIYRCEICQSTFTKSTSLKAHLVKHTGERKYRCEHCSKTFFSSSSLKIHVRVHTGDRPFKCKDCPRKFSDPSNFNKHKRWHAKQKAHGGYGEYSMHAISITPANAVSEEGDESPEVKKRRMSDNDSLGTGSLKDRRDSGGSSYEAEGGRTPEGSDNLFVDDEDEEISVDDDEMQVGFTSPKELVGMETDENDHEPATVETTVETTAEATAEATVEKDEKQEQLHEEETHMNNEERKDEKVEEN